MAVVIAIQTWLLVNHKFEFKVPPAVTSTTDSIVSLIDSVHVKHDSIYLEIIKTDTVIKYVKEQSAKNSIIINNQSIQDDILYFTGYLYMSDKQ